MVNLTVYGNPKATCTQRILILLDELSLKYEFVNVDLFKDEQKSEEFLKMNPFGMVPVVKYGNKTLFESRSILRYIAKNNKEINDLLGDVNVDMWLEVESNTFNPPISKIVYEKMFKKLKGEECNNTIVDNELKKLQSVLDIYNNVLKTRQYIGGDYYSIADISHIPYAYAFLKCGYKNELKKRENVYKWLKKIIQRENIKNILDGNYILNNKSVTENQSEHSNESENVDNDAIEETSEHTSEHTSVQKSEQDSEELNKLIENANNIKRESKNSIVNKYTEEIEKNQTKKHVEDSDEYRERKKLHRSNRYKHNAQFFK